MTPTSGRVAGHPAWALSRFEPARVTQVAYVETRETFITACHSYAIDWLDKPTTVFLQSGGPACEAAWKADAVFLGTVARIYPLTIFGFPLAWPLRTEWRTTFTVIEHFSGPTEGTIEVFTSMGGTDCGMAFQWGQDYLIYAYRVPGLHVYATNICSRTSLAREAVGDLAYLRSLPSHSPPTHIYGFVTTDFWDARRADPTTAPVADVTIHLTSKFGRWVTTTDSMGAYSFAELPAGTFSWWADLPGKPGRSREILLHEHGCSQQIVLASGK